LELLKGRADLVVNALSPAVLPALKGDKVRVVTAPGMGFAYVGFNTRSGPLADVRVRQAICHAIDVRPIVEAKFHNLADEATGMLPKTHWAYQPTEGCDFDLARSKALLDEAGFVDPDGDGPKLRLQLSYKTSTDRFRKSVALVIKEQLLQAGIGVEVRALEFGTFFSDIRKGNFELMSMKWATVVEPDLLRQVYATDQIPTAQNNWVGFNRGGFSDPKLDVLLDKALTAPLEERKTLYAAAQEIIDDELPYAPLWHEASVAAVSNRLEGFVPNAHGNFRPLEVSQQVDR
jgi:peptide/nickel transport system substrate-binding protein